MTRPLHIRPYNGVYGPLYTDFSDAGGQHCRLTETITCDIRPHLLLGAYGHLMSLTPYDARRLIGPLHHFATHGRLPHQTAPTSADYEI